MSQVVLEKWREDALERGTYRFESEERELAAEREQQQARKAREAAAASTSWYGAVDARIHEHLKNWLWKAIDEHITQWWNDNAIDERITQSWDIKCEPFKDAVGMALGKKAAQVRDELRSQFKHALQETVDAFGAEIAALEQRLVSNNQAALASTLAHERNEVQRLFETKL